MIINELNALLQQPDYQAYQNEEGYQFAKLAELYDQFTSADISSFRNKLLTDVLPALNAIKSNFKFQEFVDRYNSGAQLHRLLMLIGYITAYIDYQAYNKNVWNDYPDKRVLVKSVFNMRQWLIYFLNHKLGIGNTQVNQYTNAIKYISDPEHQLSMMSEPHRDRVAKNILGIPYNPATFPTQLVEWFRNNTNYIIRNPLNETVLISRLLYSPEVSPYWNTEAGIQHIELAPGELVYKVSMGKDHFSDTEFNAILELGLVIIHKYSKPLATSNESQGDVFTQKMKPGDYVYICRSNDRLAVIGRIVSDAVPTTFNDDWAAEDWYERKFELVKKSVKTGAYTGEQKWWAPNFLSTCYFIKPTEIDLANQLLFQPFFSSKFIYDSGPIEAATISIHNNSQTPSNMQTALNTILYGPPGTGKTYNSINKAIAIVNPEFNFDGKTREQIRNEYDKWVNKGYIEFCTFHQSMSYEDFIEGIKPLEPTDGDTYLKYKVLPGILKRLANKASYQPDTQTKVFSIPDSEYAIAQFYKMSLGGYRDPEDDAIFQYCIDNNYIALGWGDDIDFTGKSEREITQMAISKDIEKFEGTAVNYFIHYIKPGDYVIISRGNSMLRAIGRVTGPYEYKPDSPIRYHQFRKVEWVLKDKEIPVEEFYHKVFSQASIYQLDKRQIKKEFFVKADNASIPTVSKPENYVLIIDEINRGNVSAIFGELITLIEDDKRKGNKEALEVTLPYSNDKFSVPNNLYIIGTMNTADRSVEALDTALRRRFSFEEMTPDSKLLIKDDGTDKMVSGISLRKLLEVINVRISYLLDDDHCIGHSYFCGIEEDDINALKLAFKNKIIPLLREYFYNDYQKIELILGDKFITYKDSPPKFASNKHDDIGKVTYTFADINDRFDIIGALKSTLGE